MSDALARPSGKDWTFTYSQLCFLGDVSRQSIMDFLTMVYDMSR